MVDGLGETPAPRPTEQHESRERITTQQQLRTLRGQIESGTLVSLATAINTAVDYAQSTDCQLSQRKKTKIVEILAISADELDSVAVFESQNNLNAALNRLETIEKKFKESLDPLQSLAEGRYYKAIFDALLNKKNELRVKLGLPIIEATATATAVAEASATVPTTPAASPPESLDEAASLTPEQVEFNAALEADMAQGISFKEFLVKTHGDFKLKMDALKTAAPKKAGDAVDEGLADLATAIESISNQLDTIDQLAAQGKGNEAKIKLEILKSDVEQKLDASIQKLTEGRNKTLLGLGGLDDSQKAIVDEAISVLTQAKGQLPALADARTTSLVEVEAKHKVLADANQEIPPFAPSSAIAQQQQTVDQQLATIKSEAPPTGPEVADTMEQFTDKLQDAWEKMGEAMQEKKWGAVLAGLIGMLGLVLSQLKSLDSLDDWTSFVGSFGEEEAETPAGAPEKPTDIPQVLAQFGIENDTKRDEFTALKLSEVARFIEQDGVLPSGEPAYPQPLVDLKANQADAYGKLKAQLELNGFEAYHESLSDEDKSKKTLGDFITYRFNSDETKEEGWKT